MYHSITFGDKNTWDDWCLIPNGRPIFAPPAQKTNFIDIPGGNGSLDLSEVPAGYPVYNNRQGSFSFVIMNKGAAMFPECNPLKLDSIYSEIMKEIHGKKLEAILEDDPYYKYEGRFSVGNISPGADWSSIEIAYDVAPYKKSIISSVDNNWLWDPFNFENGVITQTIYSNIQLTTTWKPFTFNRTITGDEPICPKFIMTSTDGQGVYVYFRNPNLGISESIIIPNGEHVNPNIVLYGDNVDLYLRVSSGTGTASIVFNPGRL